MYNLPPIISDPHLHVTTRRSEMDFPSSPPEPDTNTSPQESLNPFLPLSILIAQNAAKPIHYGPHTIAFSYTPHLVRAILTSSHCFLPDEIQQWTVLAIVPIGVNRRHFIPLTALKAGLTPRGCYEGGCIDANSTFSHKELALKNYFNGIRMVPPDSPAAYHLPRPPSHPI
jgi:hypothetical protein